MLEWQSVDETVLKMVAAISTSPRVRLFKSRDVSDDSPLKQRHHLSSIAEEAGYHRTNPGAKGRHDEAKGYSRSHVYELFST